jgi:hypothetical protein
MFLGAYWSARQAPRNEVAVRMAGFLSDLGQLDDALSIWYPKGSKASTAPVPLDPAGISEQLTQNRRDSDGRPLLDLGWRIALWNGSHASFTALAGALSPRVVNSVILDLGLQQRLPLGEQENIIRSMVQRFEPDRAVATSSELLRASGADRPWEAAWLSYERGGSIQAGGSPY